MIQQVRGKLSQWEGKQNSLSTKTLVANQLVLGSIWYLASCFNISYASLHKIKTLVWNLVWGSQVDNKTNVRVAWDLTILPNVKGGIKKFNLPSLGPSFVNKTYYVRINSKKWILEKDYAQWVFFMANSLPSLDGSAKQGRYLKYHLDLGQEITRTSLSQS